MSTTVATPTVTNGVVKQATLTAVEVSLLQACANGRTYKEHANDVGLATQHIKNMSRTVRLKLGAITMNNAVAVGIRRGLID